MSMQTPIDPQGAHGLEHVLGIQGIKINPDQADLQTITPVIDMGMSGHARIYDPTNILYNYQSVDLGDGTASSIDEWIISHQNHQAPLDADMIYRQGFTLRIIAIWYLAHIHDPQNSLEGRTYRIYLTIERGVLGEHVPIWSATHGIFNSPAHGQQYNYPGDWYNRFSFLNADTDSAFIARWGSSNQIRAPIVPPEWGMKIHLYTNCMPVPAANYFAFPVQSFVNIYVLAQQVPHGAPIPQYW